MTTARAWRKARINGSWVSRPCVGRCPRYAALLQISIIIATFIVALSGFSRADACILVMDSFQYPDGTSLSGLGGGLQPTESLWDTAWSTDSQFVITNGKISAGNTAGTTFTATRDFSLVGPISSASTIFFMTEMSEVTDNHADFVMSIGFLSTSGGSVSFGLQGFADVGTKAFGKINTEIGYSAGTYAADNFNWMFGRLDFQSDGIDTLKVWVNPTYRNVTDGTNWDAMAVGEIGSSPASLYRLVVTAITNEAGTLKTWDDIALSSDVLGIGSPRLDIGSSGNVQTGYDEWDVGSTGSLTKSLPAAVYGGSRDSSITIAALDAEAELIVFTNEDPGVSGLAAALKGDGIMAAGGLLLSFSDWASENYLKTYHHLPEPGCALDIFISADGEHWTRIGSVMPTSGDDMPAEATFRIPAYAGDFYVKFVPQEPGGMVGINGMVVVPEPTTLGLLALGTPLALALRRKRLRPSR